MMFLQMILKEIWHRKINFLLSVGAVIIAVSLYVSFSILATASAKETSKLMLELGQNLRIIPKDTDMYKFWRVGYAEKTMPQDYVYRFAEKTGYSFTHLTATLHQAIDWRGKSIVLTGVMPEVLPPDKSHQKPMTFIVKPNTAYVGAEIATSLQVNEQDEIEIAGRKLTVVKNLSFKGDTDDIRIYCHIDDAQKILKLPGRINEIKALECMCFSNTDEDPLTAAQKQLKDLLPEGKVLLLNDKAQIRIHQRNATTGHMNLILSFIFISCGVLLGILSMMNVRDRKNELGLLQVLGYRSLSISFLFVMKAILIGILGALAGYFVGTELALTYGPKIFPLTASAIKPNRSLLIEVLLWVPLFVGVASFIPMVIALTNDPATTLRDE